MVGFKRVTLDPQQGISRAPPEPGVREKPRKGDSTGDRLRCLCDGNATRTKMCLLLPLELLCADILQSIHGGLEEKAGMTAGKEKFTQIRFHGKS